MLGGWPLSCTSSSGSTTMSNWSPLAWWMVITRTLARARGLDPLLRTRATKSSGRVVAAVLVAVGQLDQLLQPARVAARRSPRPAPATSASTVGP